MLDVLQTILEFLQGICYGTYTVVSALSDGVDFVLLGIPYSLNFINSIHGHSLFTSSFTLCLGLGLIKALYPGGD